MKERVRDTVAVHVGTRTEAHGFHGTSPPIEASSAFVADSVDRLYAVFKGEPGVVYSRLGNPTVMALEGAITALEGAAGAVAYGSGMAAIHAAWLSCGVKRDDLVLTSRDCYGSTLTLLRGVLERLGTRGMIADLCDTEAACALIAEQRPTIVHCEIISNPLMRVADIDALADAAHGVDARLVVDATFATPMLFRGFEHGADMVVHSMTKYLGGHGDITGGICAVNDEQLLAALRHTVIVTGAVLSPFDAWLTLRGMRTLPLRMAKHCDNARLVAEFLQSHPSVARTHYPGLASHPQHALASRLFEKGRYGGMLAFDLKDATREQAMSVLASLELVCPATTLGDAASLALFPAASSHRELSAAELQELGIGEGLLRLSVGIEEGADIIADLDQALARGRP